MTDFLHHWYLEEIGSFSKGQSLLNLILISSH